MPITIRSYYKTTSIDEDMLKSAIASAKDQENQILQIFKSFGVMTTWDVYEIYNELKEPILQSSVGRSINTLKNTGHLIEIGTIPGPLGRPVNLYELVDGSSDHVNRASVKRFPTHIRIPLILENGEVQIEKMMEDFDVKLDSICSSFDVKIKMN